MSNDLARVLSGVRLLILDFDGPICSIFAHYTAPTIAQELRDLLRALGRPFADEIRTTRDPLQLLRLVAETNDEETTAQIADALRDAETRAVNSAEPTPGISDLISRALERGLTLAVVSNNSREAISAYLHRAGLDGLFAAVVGRYKGQSPSSLKPNPHLLEVALSQTATDASSAILVGDSVADVMAAQAAGVACVAYRPDRQELDPLLAAGAVAGITSLHELASALATRSKGHLDAGQS